MAIEHILSDADTVQGLAVTYGTDWQSIVDYNGLEYPYTLTSLDAYNELYASGFLTVTRTLFQSDLTVYAGSTFKTELDSQGIQKTYQVVEDTVIPAGSATGYLFVRCQTFGSFGNTIAGSITVAGQVNTNLGTYLSPLTIMNEQPFTNGADAKVLITGQSIFIPEATDGTTMQVQNITDETAFLNMLGGEDLQLIDGDLTDDGYGDLGSVVGLDNIVQACYYRLLTRQGSITQHPEYGSTLHSLIGKAQSPYIRKLIELSIHDALTYDDRIESVTVNSVDIQGTSIYVDLSIVVSKVSQNFKLTLDFGS